MANVLHTTKLQGWYEQDNEHGRVRVRLAIEEGSLAIRSLSDRLLARWSLAHLETLSAPVIGTEWIIGDSRLKGPELTLDNDAEYHDLRQFAPELAPIRTRGWKQVAYALSLGNSGNLLVLVLVLSAVVYGLFQAF